MSQRLVLDRFSSIHFFDSIVKGHPIPYDRLFMDRFKHQIQRRKASTRQDGGWAFCWNLDGAEDWVDWYPYRTGVMNVQSNFNRLLMRELGLEIREYDILWGDNFLPWIKELEGTRAIRKQLGLWFILKKMASDYYISIFLKYRPKDLPSDEFPKSSLKYLEVALEVKDSWMSEVGAWMQTGQGDILEYQGKSQSRTKYFKPWRKSDWFAIKGYQKTLDFTRIEISFWGDKLDMFQKETEPSGLFEELQTLCDRAFDHCGLSPHSIVDHISEKNPVDLVGWISDRLRLHPTVLLGLGNMIDDSAIFESNRGNQSLLKMLQRRQIVRPLIELSEDRTNLKAPKKLVRGKYDFTPEFRELWRKIS